MYAIVAIKSEKSQKHHLRDFQRKLWAGQRSVAAVTGTVYNVPNTAVGAGLMTIL